MWFLIESRRNFASHGNEPSGRNHLVDIFSFFFFVVVEFFVGDPLRWEYQRGGSNQNE